jgi:hypothetical protein
MVIGVMLILGGILIAVFPQLLSLIVAGFLVLTGINILLISLYYKRASRNFDNPFIDFIFRF